MKHRELALCVLLAAACDDAEPRVALPCDVRARACQLSVFEVTAEVRRQRRARPPPVRVISRQQYADELRAALEASQTEAPDEATTAWRNVQRALTLFELLPSEQSYDEAYVEQAVESVAAYYSSASKDITIIADTADDERSATFTLAHEYVHALQDQREDLGRLRAQLASSSDADTALTALIEGEATWLSIVAYRGAALGEQPEDIDARVIFASTLEATLQDIAAAPAPLINAAELLPYALGGARLAQRYGTGGASSIAALYADPPLALLAWVDDPSLRRVALEQLPEPLDCGAPEAPDGYEVLPQDQLGFAGLLAFGVALGQSGADAYQAATRWRADQLASYVAQDGSQALAAAWRIRMASASAAQELHAATEALPALRAAALDREVLISAASDPSLLEGWPATDCPADDKARRPPADRRRLALRDRLELVR